MANWPIFPVFADHEAAARWGCFQCATPFVEGDARDAGYAAGRAKYGCKCKRCGATSFYDLIREHPAGHEHALQLAIETQKQRR